MRRPVVTLGLAFLGLAAVAMFAGWAFFQSSQPAERGPTLGPIWPYVAGGALLVVVLAGFLMWLAIYSARHGLDD